MFISNRSLSGSLSFLADETVSKEPPVPEINSDHGQEYNINEDIVIDVNDDITYKEKIAVSYRNQFLEILSNICELINSNISWAIEYTQEELIENAIIDLYIDHTIESKSEDLRPLPIDYFIRLLMGNNFDWPENMLNRIETACHELFPVIEDDDCGRDYALPEIRNYELMLDGVYPPPEDLSDDE